MQRTPRRDERGAILGLPRPSRGPRRDPARSAFTLVEMVVALSVLTVALLGFASFFVVNARSYDRVREDALVIHALRRTAEEIRGDPFARLVILHQGQTFTIPVINATGRITIFTNETDSSADARLLGLPRDLNGDGNAITADVSASYSLLPFKIEVTWGNGLNPQSKALYLLLAQERN